LGFPAETLDGAMDLIIEGFDWDEGNLAKCQSHGVMIAEIEAALRDQPRVAPDPTHSSDEDRLIAIGKNQRGRPLFVAFTIRERNHRRLIRPITARYMQGRYGDMKRQVPKMTTDAEAEAFLESDLSDVDFAQFKTVRFEFSDENEHVKRRGRHAAAVPTGLRPVHLAPGTPAPRSGVYQQIGPRGGRLGQRVISVAGKPLPPAPTGRTWTLVDPSHQKRHKTS
jgi:uncharacterized DUF497 family protein